MNNAKYNKPLIEVIEMETEGTLALSGGSTNLQDAGQYSGSANSKEMVFWDDY